VAVECRQSLFTLIRRLFVQAK